MKRILLTIAVVALAGCGSTAYQKSGLTGGYSAKRLEPGTFRVEYAGNAYTEGSRATDFCFLRCAELTLENEYKYFKVVDQDKSWLHWKKLILTIRFEKERTGLNYDHLLNHLRQDGLIYVPGEGYADFAKDHSFDAQTLSDSIRKKYNLNP